MPVKSFSSLFLIQTPVFPNKGALHMCEPSARFDGDLMAPHLCGNIPHDCCIIHQKPWTM
jgi:hypothetical protein